MRIDENKCAGCGQCSEFCALGICMTRRKNPDTGRYYYQINEDECVDCGVCYRSGACSTGAIFMPDYEYPRTLRQQFSDPLVVHPKTNVPGRGTEEMKTIEITGRVPRGYCGIACEMGRPSVGARFSEVEKVAMALAKLNVEFEPVNPCTMVMENPHIGTFKDEVKNEKVLSAIIEMVVKIEEAPAILNTIREVSSIVKCPFSVDFFAPLEPDGTPPTLKVLEDINWTPAPNIKMNTGLGRPLAKNAEVTK